MTLNSLKQKTDRSVCARVFISVCVCFHVFVRARVYACVCVTAHVCAWVCIYVCVCVCTRTVTSMSVTPQFRTPCLSVYLFVPLPPQKLLTHLDCLLVFCILLTCKSCTLFEFTGHKDIAALLIMHSCNINSQDFKGYGSLSLSLSLSFSLFVYICVCVSKRK